MNKKEWFDTAASGVRHIPGIEHNRVARETPKDRPLTDMKTISSKTMTTEERNKQTSGYGENEDRERTCSRKIHLPEHYGKEWNYV